MSRALTHLDDIPAFGFGFFFPGSEKKKQKLKFFEVGRSLQCATPENKKPYPFAISPEGKVRKHSHGYKAYSTTLSK